MAGHAVDMRVLYSPRLISLSFNRNCLRNHYSKPILKEVPAASTGYVQLDMRSAGSVGEGCSCDNCFCTGAIESIRDVHPTEEHGERACRVRHFWNAHVRQSGTRALLLGASAKDDGCDDGRGVPRKPHSPHLAACHVGVGVHAVNHRRDWFQCALLRFRVPLPLELPLGAGCSPGGD